MASSGLRVLRVSDRVGHRGTGGRLRKRAINRMSAWRYTDFQTVLIAPTSFIGRWPQDGVRLRSGQVEQQQLTGEPGFRNRIHTRARARSGQTCMRTRFWKYVALPRIVLAKRERVVMLQRAGANARDFVGSKGTRATRNVST